jgi:8-oxo-dGTP diphosphatase
MNAELEIPPKRPVVGVSALVRRDGQVLLVRRGRPPSAGLWSLPGGKVEFGERLEAAAIREIREETGIAIDRLQRIDMAEIIGMPDWHAVLVVFSGRYVAGDAVAGDDAAEARWVDRDGLTGLALTADSRRVIETHGLTP